MIDLKRKKCERTKNRWSSPKDFLKIFCHDFSYDVCAGHGVNDFYHQKIFRFLSTVMMLIMLLLGFPLGSAAPIHGEEPGFKYHRNYTYQDYRHQQQNRGILQAENGMIYAANQGGVLEYDGVSWRVLQVPGYNPVYSLAMDKKGTLYVGGYNKLGRLVAGAQGDFTYKSLLNGKEGKPRKFKEVQSAHATTHGVYFRTLRYLFRWHEEKLTAISGNGYFIASFFCDGVLYLQETGRGLMKVESGLLNPLPGGEFFAGTKQKITMLVPHKKENSDFILLVGTSGNGFYLWDGEKPTPFSTELDKHMERNVLHHGIRLSGGEYALATRQKGLFIMDAKGNILEHFHRASGLQSETVNYIFQEKGGNLWLALDEGITRVEYHSPFLIYDLPGNLMTVARVGDTVYAGTTKGMFLKKGKLGAFKAIEKIFSGCRDLLPTGQSLLAATARGLFQVDGTRVRQICGGICYALHQRKGNKNMAWCNTRTGLLLLVREKGKWTKKYKYNEITGRVGSLAEDEKGNLWLGKSLGKVTKIVFPSVYGQGVHGVQGPVVTEYGKNEGLPGGKCYVNEIAGRILFATPEGLYRYNDGASAGENRFVPDGLLGKKWSDGSQPIFRISGNDEGRIWFHSAGRNYEAMVGVDGRYVVGDLPFRRIPTAQANAIYPDPNGRYVWFGSYEGLFRYRSGPIPPKKLDAHNGSISSKHPMPSKAVQDGGQGEPPPGPPGGPSESRRRQVTKTTASLSRPLFAR